MAYSLAYLPEAVNELSSMFSKSERRQITRKLRQVVENIPASLRLKTVTRLGGVQQLLLLSGADAAYELRIGSGHRAAFALFHDRQLAVVYMVGTHDYANSLFIKALTRIPHDGG